MYQEPTAQPFAPGAEPRALHRHPSPVREPAVAVTQLVEMFPTIAVDSHARPTDYAGRRASVLAWLGNRVTWQAVQHWRKGSRKMPAWAINALEAGAHQQARKWLAIANAFTAMKKPAD